MSKKIVLGILIVVLAAVLRLIDLGNNPPGVYVDEAVHGYNAYSLLTTGRDEYGNPLPILLRSFGTYPPALYTYFTVPVVKLLGLNSLAIRLPSAVLGILLVAIVYLWFGPVVGLIVAISPGFILWSRTVSEPNLGLTLLVLGTFLSLKSLPLSFLILALSGYAYPAQRFLAPLTLIFLSYHYRYRKHWLLSIIVATIVLLPLVWVSLTPGANSRLIHLFEPASAARLYLSYFSPNNLFSRPDPDIQRSFPEVSIFHWWMFIPFVVGLIKSKKTGILKILLFWAILAPVPGAISGDYFSTLRTLPLFLVLAWVIAKGFPKKAIVIIPLLVLSLVELYSNMVLLKHERSSVWNYEYRQISHFISSHSQDQIVVDNSRFKPIYILWAFHSQVSPRLLQSRGFGGNYYSGFDFPDTLAFTNLAFRPINWREDVYARQYLIADLLAVSDSQAREHFLTLEDVITDLNGRPVERIFLTHPDKKCNVPINRDNPFCKQIVVQ
ncbi:MAG: hypothetical protein AAB697_03145 [Patescibacteria group bacterium]